MKDPTEILTVDDKIEDTHEGNLEYWRELIHLQDLASLTALTEETTHKMNNLIGAVIGYVSMLQADIRQDETAYEYTQETMKAAQKIADLNNNLLSYARARYGSASKVNINEQLKKLVRLYEDMSRNQISVELQITEKVLDVYGNQNMIFLALANIFLNVQESITDDGIITITARRGQLPKSYHFGDPKPTNSEYAIISICNNSCRIDMDDIKEIFKAALTMEKISVNKFGLLTAFCIIHRNKGAIYIDTGSGDESNFHVYLPLIQGD